MRLRSYAFISLVGAFLAPLLAASVAAAQYPPPPPPPGYYPPPPYARGEPDGPRFRGGILLEGGLLAVPGVVNVGDIEIQGQLGVQFNNNWGVYLIPGVDIIVGKYNGLGAEIGALFDYTFDNVPISLGAGPEIGGFAAIGSCQFGTVGCTVGGAGGGFYGGRVRFMYHPILVRSDMNPRRRRAFSIGVDVRALYGAFGAESTNAGLLTAAAGYGFGLAPMVLLGYNAF
jgi:hypothetical protein